MDLARTLYRSSQRLFRDRPEVLTPGRWRWCPPGARPVPYLHCYGISYDNLDREKEPPLGESVLSPRRQYSDYEPTRLTGQGVCGAEGLWREGGLWADRTVLPTRPDGVPTCCPARAIEPTGDAIGGASVQRMGGTPMGGIGMGG
jgi:hypothetical protein